MRLVNLQLTNFRKISNLPEPTVKFNKDINVLVGANNAGKTSLLKAIQKLFNVENIASKDLHYLINSDNLLVKGEILFSQLEWQTYLSICLNRLKDRVNLAEIRDLALLGAELSTQNISLKHNWTFATKNITDHLVESFLDKKNIQKIAKNPSEQVLIEYTVEYLATSNFYNVYKTPLYLDSKGEVMEKESFMPLIEIENRIGNKEQKNIRGLLYALKKKEPLEFQELKKTVLSIFAELEDIDVVHNEDIGEFELILREKLRKNGTTEDVSYDIKEVGQGMQSLVLMLSTILLLKPRIVLLDEPEVHMHPSLIAEFVRYIRLLSSDIQFVMTTHSLVLMNEVGMDKIFVMKNEPEQKGVCIYKLETQNQWLDTKDYVMSTELQTLLKKIG